MKQRELKIAERYLGASEKASKFEACYDFLLNGGTAAVCAKKWGWTVKTASSFIDEIVECYKKKDKTDEFVPQREKEITGKTISSLSSMELNSVPSERLEFIRDNGVYEDGERIEDAEHLNMIRFQLWYRLNAPYCAKNIATLTLDQFHKLKVVYKYTSNEIMHTIQQIENRKDLRKRYQEMYPTLLNWLKRDYGDRREGK